MRQDRHTFDDAGVTLIVRGIGRMFPDTGLWWFAATNSELMVQTVVVR